MESLVIAEDHKLIIEGYKLLINEIDGLEIVDIVLNGERAIQAVERCKPDYLILDLHMPKVNGLEVLTYVSEHQLKTKVIIISMFGDASMHKEALRLGAKGYILKHADQEEFTTAINMVRRGKNYYSAEIFEEQETINNIPGTKPIIPMVSLSSKEEEILVLIASGKTNKEIAKMLNRSYKTIDTHRTNLMKKINANNVTGLVRYAIANGYNI